MSLSKIVEAMCVAGGLPSLEDAKGWEQLGALWRARGADEHTQLEAARAEIEDMNEALNDQEEQIERQTEGIRRTLADLAAQRELAKERDRTATGLAEQNTVLCNVIDKLALTVPGFQVRKVFREIVARCEANVGSHTDPLLSGQLSPDEARWHPILRAILNDARRGLKAIEEGASK